MSHIASEIEAQMCAALISPQAAIWPNQHLVQEGDGMPASPPAGVYNVS